MCVTGETHYINVTEKALSTAFSISTYLLDLLYVNHF